MKTVERQLVASAISVIQRNVERVAEALYRRGTDSYKKFVTETGEAFEEYIRSSIAKYSQVKTLIQSSAPIHLYDYYVHMNVSLSGGEIILADTVDKISTSGRQIIVIGTGGSGKSTLLRHLFLNSLGKSGPIPLFVQLRELNDNDDTILEHIFKSITNGGYKFEMKYLEYALSIGSFILLLDGFDEVTDLRKKDISNEIIGLSDKYPDNYVIVSSRRMNQFFQSWSRFVEVEVEPLSQTQALDLIRIAKFDPDIKQRFLKELASDLYTKHTSFASNPLLLSIMLITYAQNAEIPDKKHLFYRNAFEALYSRHDALKGGFKRDMKSGLASDDFRRILSAFSALSYVDKVNTFDEESLPQYLIDTQKLEPNVPFDVDSYKSDLVNAVCILREDGLRYVYNHRSFQEYFTAKYITNLEDSEQLPLLEAFFQTQPTSVKYDDVLNLMFEIDRPRFEKNVVIPILKNVFSMVSGGARDENYFNFVQLGMKSIVIDESLLDLNEEPYRTKGDCVVFEVDMSPDVWKREFVDAWYVKYSTLYKFMLPNHENTSGIEQIEQFGTVRRLRISVALSDVTIGSALFHEILGHCSYFKSQYDYLELLLAELIKTHETRKAAKDLLLRFKRG